MKIFNKIILILIIVIACTLMFSKNSMAMQDWDSMKEQADGFIQKGESEGGDTVIPQESLQNFAMPIARTLLAIASGVLAVVTIIVGIQYSMANPSDKAKLKQKLVGLLVSTIVIFGAQGIWAIMYKFMTQVTQ